MFFQRRAQGFVKLLGERRVDRIGRPPVQLVVAPAAVGEAGARVLRVVGYAAAAAVAGWIEDAGIEPWPECESLW